MQGLVNVGVHRHSATLHLETLGIRDRTITMGLVDAFKAVLTAEPVGAEPARKEALAGAA